jgi:iron complex outermembrane receptor protein
MKFARKPIAVAVALSLPSLWQGAVAQESSATPVMSEVVVKASKIQDQEPFGASRLDAASVTPYRAASSDSASLLDALPGVSRYGAGGVSSLPAIHGLADDRIRIQVDGMDLISSCANHMNPPLSYIDPTLVGSVRLFSGITPVSVGGDSIAGTIQVNSATPRLCQGRRRPACSPVRRVPSIAATATAGAPICRRRWPTRCSA